MAIYGNRNTGEITPNNFATRPGVLPGKIASAPSTDYLFGSNLGILQEENNLSISKACKLRNLSISKATIRSAIPRPFMLGAFPDLSKLGSSNKKNIIDGAKTAIGYIMLFVMIQETTRRFR